MAHLLLVLSILAAFQLPPSGDDRVAQYIATLIACAEAEEWKVEFGPMPVLLADTFMAGDRVHQIMVVNEKLDGIGRIGALLYQLAYIHRPAHLSRDDQKVWAESTARRTLLRLGIPTDASDAYLQQFPRARSIAISERNTIDAESASIQACVVMGPKGIAKQ